MHKTNAATAKEEVQSKRKSLEEKVNDNNRTRRQGSTVLLTTAHSHDLPFRCDAKVQSKRKRSLPADTKTTTREHGGNSLPVVRTTAHSDDSLFWCGQSEQKKSLPEDKGNCKKGARWQGLPVLRTDVHLLFRCDQHKRKKSLPEGKGNCKKGARRQGSTSSWNGCSFAFPMRRSLNKRSPCQKARATANKRTRRQGSTSSSNGRFAFPMWRGLNERSSCQKTRARRNTVPVLRTATKKKSSSTKRRDGNKNSDTKVSCNRETEQTNRGDRLQKPSQTTLYDSLLVRVAEPFLRAFPFRSVSSSTLLFSLQSKNKCQ